MIIKNISSIKELTGIHTYPIPPITQLSFWLKADAGVNGGNPNDGDPVTNWDDQGPNGFNFSQGTFVNQPIWNRTGANGQPYLEFTNPTYLELFSSDLFSNDECSIYVVFKKNSAASGGQIGRIFMLNVSSYTNNTGGSYLDLIALDTLATFPNDHHYMNAVNAGVEIDFGLDTTNPTLLTYIKTDTSVIGRTNSVLVDSNSGSQSLNQNLAHFIGSWFNPGSTLEGEIYEIIAYDGVHNATEITIVENYLTSKYTI